jgi:hypothetical protein
MWGIFLVLTRLVASPPIKPALEGDWAWTLKAELRNRLIIIIRMAGRE